jgi:holo-[acyl-carrier protein] synthase
MIHGIGIDIVRVERIRAGLERHGERFARRILAEEELAEMARCACPAEFLAKRFAAKEAAAKAIGTGLREGLALRDIAVGHDGRGRPVLVFHGRARELCTELGIGESHLSIADEREYAVASVTLLRGAAAPRGPD